MNPGRFWFSVPSPYTTHEPMLGFAIRSEPVFMNTVATSWAGMSVYMERTTAMSSTCWPIPGKSSLTSIPDRPMGVNLNGEPMATPLSPIVLPSIRTNLLLNQHAGESSCFRPTSQNSRVPADGHPRRRVVSEVIPDESLPHFAPGLVDHLDPKS